MYEHSNYLKGVAPLYIATVTELGKETTGTSFGVHKSKVRMSWGRASSPNDDGFMY